MNPTMPGNSLVLDPAASPLATWVGPERLLLTAAEASKALSISPRSLWELSIRIDKKTGQLVGEIPVVRVARRGVRYTYEDLLEWIERHKTSAAAADAKQVRDELTRLAAEESSPTEAAPP